MCIRDRCSKPPRPWGADMAENGIGVSVKRKEDNRFLTGKGNYTDDINRPGQPFAVLVRSPHAHATINSIDISAA